MQSLQAVTNALEVDTVDTAHMVSNLIAIFLTMIDPFYVVGSSIPVLTAQPL
jgi:hypothetical protein